jgi:hypothetical protein
MSRGDAHAAMHRNALLIADDPADVEAMIDGVKDRTASISLHSGKDATWRDQWDVYALFENRDGLLTEYLEEGHGQMMTACASALADAGDAPAETGPEVSVIGPEEISLSSVVSGEAALDIGAANEIRGTAMFLCQGEEEARELATRLAEHLDILVRQLDDESLIVDVDTRANGDRVEVDVTIEDLDAWLRDLVRRSITHSMP